MSIDLVDEMSYSKRKCKIIEKIAVKLIEQGHDFVDRESISKGLEPAIW